MAFRARSRHPTYAACALYVLNTRLYLGFLTDLADREEGEIY
jgi:hypothetical protein